MNNIQKTLYDNLMALVQSNDAFFTRDAKLDDCLYRVFSYRMASYTDFCTPGALESRGIMFELDDAGNPIRLAAMPMEKFFNDKENPSTIDLDYSNIEQVTLKMDGSLMSSFIHKGELRIKSKTALASEHAINAMRWLNLPENAEFKQELTDVTLAGLTVNMEYTSPEPFMRIVIGYQEPKLTVLNVRNTANGEYVVKSMLLDKTQIMKYWVDEVSHEQLSDGQAFVDSISDMTGIEGFVIQLKSGQHVKKKTLWYSALHHTKDSVNNPRRLFEVVLDEASDDLKQMFHDDAYALKAIEEMEVKVAGWYNKLVKSVEEFHDKYKDEDRKTYAIAGQAELDKLGFPLAMLLYQNKPFSYKDFMKKWYKEFGLVDETIAGDE